MYFHLTVAFLYPQVVCQTVVNFVFHGGIEMTAVMSCKNSTLKSQVIV